MSYKLESNGFKPKGPVLLCILDGVGIAPEGPGNALLAANPVNMLKYQKDCKEANLFAELFAHGPYVGLPDKTDMGNSEVGHNAMGCGQIYGQGAKLVNVSLKNKSFFKTAVWDNLVGQAADKGKTVHMLGLLSDGNVHSHIEQVFLMLDGIVASGVKRIRLHPLLDGRDVPPDSGLIYIDQLEAKLAELRASGVDAMIGSGGGRMYCVMDRYGSDWSIVRRGYDMIVHGHVAEEAITPEYSGYYTSAREAVETARRFFPRKLDQFNPPFVVVDKDNIPVGKVADGDTVINFNFRGDRAIQITKAFTFETFKEFNRDAIAANPKVKYAGLLEYDTEAHLPENYLVPPPEIHNVLGQFTAAQGISSYALAETHKYGHVTYFWNGNSSGYIKEELETYEEVKSEPTTMIEENPVMKCPEVTEKLLGALKSKKYQFLRVNYANGDMVGHTGSIPASIKSVQAMDKDLKLVVDEVLAQGGIMMITADHGNVEEMLDKTGKAKTSHTTNKVAFYVVAKGYDGKIKVDVSNIENAGIANIAATTLNLLGYKAPDFYEKSLVQVS